MTILKNTFYKGYLFSQTWPKHEPYLLMFEQTKAIRLTDMSLTAAPAIALITIWLQIYYFGVDSLHSAIAMSIMLLSIPAHGFYQLGQQADTRLPISLQNWYREIENKVQAQHQADLSYYSKDDKKLPPEGWVTNNKVNSRLTFMDLALLLNRLFGGNNKKKH
ncbi:DUF412 family protein [Psychrosphaera haliotis]|uniref:UPF0208 membrane protein YfbV n=1 Tax=Psychrosphaera haliotis TaxID=555083 RepID=A0A6N8F463_9GAMM|nr:DUF412 family protein [Psychrosphaera haliotis]MUH71053.1 DUF412 family protein [Psychrosphaera haliotis]